MQNDQAGMAAESGIVSNVLIHTGSGVGVGDGVGKCQKVTTNPQNLSLLRYFFQQRSVFPRFITFPNCPINGGNTRIQIHEPTGAFLYSNLKQKLCVYSWCPLMSLLLSMIYKIRSKPCLTSPFPWMCCFRTGPRIFVVGMGCT